MVDFLYFASLYQILGIANVGHIGNVMTTSLNQEKKKRASCVMSTFNVKLCVPAWPIYGLILDRWGEYDKHGAVIAYKKYIFYSITLIVFSIIIRNYRFRNKIEKFIFDEKMDEVEYIEPLEEFVNDYKNKITNDDNKDIEMMNI